MSRLTSLLSLKPTQRNSPNWAFMELFKVPHYDDPKKDYLWRLRIIQTPWFGVYLHKLCTPDPRDTLHNHPWNFFSIILRGGYKEYIQCNCDFEHCDYYAVRRHVTRFNYKPLKNSFHWIAELDKDPTWTLVFVGRRRRVWGYLDREGNYTDYNKHEFNDQYQAAMEKRGGGDVM